MTPVRSGRSLSHCLNTTWTKGLLGTGRPGKKRTGRTGSDDRPQGAALLQAERADEERRHLPARVHRVGAEVAVAAAGGHALVGELLDPLRERVGQARSAKRPAGGGGTYPAACLARIRKTAIWSRVTTACGQKFPPPQPAVIPSEASFSIHAAPKCWCARRGTCSPRRPAARSWRRTSTSGGRPPSGRASRRTEGQYFPSPQPLVIWLPRSSRRSRRTGSTGACRGT